MDQLIKDYILTRLPHEIGIEIFRTFRFMTEFNYVDHELPFINLLMAEDLNETQELQDQFIHLVYSQQDDIFKAHLLKISAHSTLFQRNEILSTLHQLLSLESYQDIDAILSSTKDRLHAFSLIIERLSSLDEHTCLDIVEDIDPVAYIALSQFAHKQTLLRNSTTRTYTPEGQQIIANMRSFIAFVANRQLIGASLMDSGVILDQSVSRYKTYLPVDVFDQKQTKDIAQDLLSLIYLSQEGIDQPLQVFKEAVHLFFSDLHYIAEIEQAFTAVLDDYTTYLKVENEKARLLQSRS